MRRPVVWARPSDYAAALRSGAVWATVIVTGLIVLAFVALLSLIWDGAFGFASVTCIGPLSVIFEDARDRARARHADQDGRGH